ncbi:MAG: ankyrin repeat domain-containing protein [Pseudomonadota bacterium]
MTKKPKTRQKLEDILASCSEALFPAEMGSAPVSIGSRASNGDTPLHVMAWRIDTHGALQLIDAGADVNAAGDMSETPLHIAVRKKDLTVVEALLRAGADPDRVSELGNTPRKFADELGGEMRRLFIKV